MEPESHTIFEKVLGKEHPSTTSYITSRRCIERQGDYPQALEFYEKAFMIVYKKLGEANPKTKTICYNMRAAYLALGHTEQEFNQYLSDLLSILSPPRYPRRLMSANLTSKSASVVNTVVTPHPSTSATAWATTTSAVPPSVSPWHAWQLVKQQSATNKRIAPSKTKVLLNRGALFCS